MGKPSSIIQKNCQTWTKNGEITAQRLEFRNRADAMRVKRSLEQKERRVTISVSRFRSPKRSAEIYILTIRPVPAYEKHAANAKGFGVTGHEPSRAPTAEEKAKAKARAKANRV
jgi:hypothetical protein